MSATTDILKLADSLRAAQDLADRADSLEQACREAESRLGGLREQEAASTRKLGEARAEAKRILDDVKADCQVARERCEAACQKREAETEAVSAQRIADAHDVCDELAGEASEYSARIASLEAEESDAGQKVAALRDALADLRAKLS